MAGEDFRKQLPTFYKAHTLLLIPRRYIFKQNYLIILNKVFVLRDLKCNDTCSKEQQLFGLEN